MSGDVLWIVHGYGISVENIELVCRTQSTHCVHEAKCAYQTASADFASDIPGAQAIQDFHGACSKLIRSSNSIRMQLHARSLPIRPPLLGNQRHQPHQLRRFENIPRSLPFQQRHQLPYPLHPNAYRQQVPRIRPRPLQKLEALQFFNSTHNRHQEHENVKSSNCSLRWQGRYDGKYRRLTQNKKRKLRCSG